MLAHEAKEAKKTPEIIAFIPARGGSTGIPDKNMVDLGGHPLFAHSVRAALSCPMIHRIVVSTDSERIADKAREYGAEVPFLRPAEFSGGTAVIDDAVQHMFRELERREGYKPDCVVVLFPTHPVRSKAMMHQLVGKLAAGYREVITAVPVPVGPLSHFVPRDGRLVSLHGKRPGQLC